MGRGADGAALCCDQLGGRRIYRKGVGFGGFNKSWVESCDIMHGGAVVQLHQKLSHLSGLR